MKILIATANPGKFQEIAADSRPGMEHDSIFYYPPKNILTKTI